MCCMYMVCKKDMTVNLLKDQGQRSGSSSKVEV